jgi:hypothetical protein
MPTKGNSQQAAEKLFLSRKEHTSGAKARLI